MTQVKGSMSVLGLKGIGSVLQKLGKAVTYAWANLRGCRRHLQEIPIKASLRIQTGQDNQ